MAKLISKEIESEINFLAYDIEVEDNHNYFANDVLVHNCKNPSSQQGKAFIKLDADVRIAMTGTPLMNSPLDLYIILRWLGYEKHSFYAFRNHHCIMGGFGGYEIVGYKKAA